MMNAKPPTLAEVIELRQRVPDSLESMAASINRRVDLFTRAAGTSQAHRVRCGFELIAARKTVEAEGLGWEAWCADNIHCSYRDIKRMMAMARSDDPEAAHEKERAKTRKAVAEHRARGTYVSPPSAEDVVRDFMALDDEGKAKFMRLIQGWRSAGD
jgi:hypothetical protein